jgi:hypothetical protein
MMSMIKSKFDRHMHNDFKLWAMKMIINAIKEIIYNLDKLGTIVHL